MLCCGAKLSFLRLAEQRILRLFRLGAGRRGNPPAAQAPIAAPGQAKEVELQRTIRPITREQRGGRGGARRR